MALSSTHAAAGDKAGNLWVVDLRSDEGLLLSRQKMSWFGAILAVAWSDDGDFVVAGSQDDLVTVWSLSQQAIVARGVGHTSWVASVAFDTKASRSPRELRIVSSGHDGRLLLWDFEHDLDEVPRRAGSTPPEMTPVAEHVVSGDPVTAVLCFDEALLVASTMAELTWWARPSDAPSLSQV
jgi:WD40 repeat protein